MAHLVQSMSDVEVTIGVGRAIVQCEHLLWHAEDRDTQNRPTKGSSGVQQLDKQPLVYALCAVSPHG